MSHWRLERLTQGSLAAAQQDSSQKTLSLGKGHFQSPEGRLSSPHPQLLPLCTQESPKGELGGGFLPKLTHWLSDGFTVDEEAGRAQEGPRPRFRKWVFC